ncbi:pyridoxamine 5'-phosphate oxidase family protein [Arenibacterium sp. CAU 1754]
MTGISKSEASKTLFDVLEDTRTGMLGITGSGQHFQPMTHFADADEKTLRFITARDTDLAKAVGLGGQAHYTLTNEDKGFYACVSGPIMASENQAKLKELWSPMVGAWFDGGPEDPEAVLLEMPLAEASIWQSTTSGLKFGFELARALMSDERKPDVGDHVVLNFGAAA